MINDRTFVHDAKFSWDDGQGECTCSAMYFETRCLQRVAAGKAAEARLQKQHQLAAEFDVKARSLGMRLDELRKQGHIGKAVRFNEGEFRSAFKNATAGTLSIL